MKTNKFADAAITVLMVLFGLWLLEVILGIGIGILGLVFSLIGGLCGLIFSKSGVALVGIGLIVYLIGRKNDRRGNYDDTYRY